MMNIIKYIIIILKIYKDEDSFTHRRIMLFLKNKNKYITLLINFYNY